MCKDFTKKLDWKNFGVHKNTIQLDIIVTIEVLQTIHC